MPDPLFMIRLGVHAGLLAGHGRRRRLPTWDVDHGYLVHSLMREAFGDKAPQPFAITSDRGRFLSVLGYSGVDADALRTDAQRFGDPAVIAALDLEHMASKELPAEWPTGLEVAFEARVCPVVRLSDRADARGHGSEVDAFLARCREVGPDVTVDRQEVYRHWFSRQLETHGGARPAGPLQVQRFALSRFVRRTHGERRVARTLQLPDVTVSGRLEITEPDAFRSLLRRGIGRHRAFGFGMLLLRRA